MAEGQWKWDEHQQWEITSSFYTGVYGMWNVYTIALLILYAPSHKQWPSADTGSASVACTATTTDGDGEEIEFSRMPSESMPTEISSLTAFAQKTSID